ncbi:MAG: hypothetical protein RID59_12575, partial [Hoeflea sp.]
MGSVRFFCVVAFSLLFGMISQALAGNWIFEESTDPSDGRKGVIVYKSDRFDTTPGAFARFIVRDNKTLAFRIRNQSNGQMTKKPEVGFVLSKESEESVSFPIYDVDAAANSGGCVAQTNLATGCELSCARSSEDFALGDEVACTTDSNSNLWIGFRAEFSPDHMNRILQAAEYLSGIQFYGGSDDYWFVDTDELLKHICDQTKASDHPCRDELQVSVASDSTKPQCLHQETLGDFSILVSNQGWAIYVSSSDREDGRKKSFKIALDHNYGEVMSLLLGQYEEFEHLDKIDIKFVLQNNRWKIPSTVYIGGVVGVDADYLWDVTIRKGDSQYYDEIFANLDELEDVAMTISFQDTDDTVSNMVFPLRGLSNARTIAKDRYEEIRTD